jgi:hypothetical protein
MKRFFFAILLFVSTKSFAQNKSCEWFITPNVNLYIPVNNPAKGVYPVLWYDSETKPKLLIGGFGMGISVYKPLTEKISLKGQVNLSKYTYWDERFYARESGSLYKDYLSGSSDYTLGLTVTAHYFITKKLSMGTGLGSHILLISLSRLPELELNTGKSSGGVARNRYYKPLMPVFPIELSLKLEKILFNIRYEYGLLNRIKGDLKQYLNDRYSLLVFEVGFKIK